MASTFKRVLEKCGISGYELSIMSGHCMSGVYRFISGERDIRKAKLETLMSFAHVLTNDDLNQLILMIAKEDELLQKEKQESRIKE